MASLPVIANTNRVVLRWGGDAPDAVNVMHIKGVSSYPNAADLFTSLDSNIAVDCMVFQPSGVGVINIEITKLDGTSATEEFIPTNSAWVGQQGGLGIPNQANIIKLKTPHRGRSYTGRVFLPYVAESAVAAGVLTGSYVDDCTSSWNTFATGLAGDDYGFAVASYKLALSTLVTNIHCEPIAATQRRRLSRLR